jgi:hypothetical protein
MSTSNARPKMSGGTSPSAESIRTQPAGKGVAGAVPPAAGSTSIRTSAVVVLREGDISPRTPQIALGALLARVGKPAVCDVPDYQAMHIEREDHDRTRANASRDPRRGKVQAGRL